MQNAPPPFKAVSAFCGLHILCRISNDYIIIRLYKIVKPFCSAYIYILDIVSLSAQKGSEILQRNFKIVRIGSEYEVTRFLYDREIICSGGGSKSSNNGERDSANLLRARRAVMEYIACNDWQYFVTLTLSSKYDREGLSSWRSSFTHWLRNLRRSGRDIKYCFVPERHKAGGWHMHGVISGLLPDDVVSFTPDDIGSNETADDVKRYTASALNAKGYLCWRAYSLKYGYCSCAPVRDRQACARYITKYITKDMACNVLDSGAHLYYASRGLARAETLDEGSLTSDGWLFCQGDSTIEHALVSSSCGVSYFCNEYIERWTFSDSHFLPELCGTRLEHLTRVDFLGSDKTT